ncbi:hypothetical protein Q5O89_15595 [Peribacillus frigoritolerans]|nr:hypothetical protein [Peribacillus frigoritolerans]
MSKINENIQRFASQHFGKDGKFKTNVTVFVMQIHDEEEEE